VKRSQATVPLKNGLGSPTKKRTAGRFMNYVRHPKTSRGATLQKKGDFTAFLYIMVQNLKSVYKRVRYHSKISKLKNCYSYFSQSWCPHTISAEFETNLQSDISFKRLPKHDLKSVRADDLD
jgi:hypothetical protein